MEFLAFEHLANVWNDVCKPQCFVDVAGPKGDSRCTAFRALSTAWHRWWRIMSASLGGIIGALSGPWPGACRANEDRLSRPCTGMSLRPYGSTPRNTPSRVYAPRRALDSSSPKMTHVVVSRPSTRAFASAMPSSTRAPPAYSNVSRLVGTMPRRLSVAPGIYGRGCSGVAEGLQLFEALASERRQSLSVR